MDNRNQPDGGMLAKALQQRADLFAVIVLAVFVGLGINLLAGVLQAAIHDAKVVVAVGLALVFSILLVVLAFSRQLVSRRTFQFPILFDETSKRTGVVPDFEISGDLRKTLEGLFAENVAFKHQWESNWLGRASHCDEKADDAAESSNTKGAAQETVSYISIHRVDSAEPPVASDINQAAILLIGTIEYLLIKQLSLHLSSYYTDAGDARTITYVRRDLATATSR